MKVIIESIIPHMKIYFVRHGEGEHNIKKLFSTPFFELTEKGEQQATLAAKRIEKLPIELIITSPFKRTVQTTEIINRHLQKEVILSDLAVEIKRAKEVAGKSMEDPKILAIKKIVDQNFHLPDWHYSDEENFYDLKKRASAFIKYLQNFKQNHILIVTHAHFIKMVVLTMMLKENLTSQVFLKALNFLKLETSGLTICEYDQQEWKLITWNDYSHLA